MTQQLRAVDALPEDQIQFPAPTEQPTNVCNSRFKGPSACFQPHHTHARGTYHKYICAAQTFVYMQENERSRSAQ